MLRTRRRVAFRFSPWRSLPIPFRAPPLLPLQVSFLFLPGSLEIHPIKCNLAKSLPSKEVPGIKIRVSEAEREREQAVQDTAAAVVGSLPWNYAYDMQGAPWSASILLCGLIIELPIAEKHHYLIKLLFKCHGYLCTRDFSLPAPQHEHLLSPRVPKLGGWLRRRSRNCWNLALLQI